jgi:hypothetical protein
MNRRCLADFGQTRRAVVCRHEFRLLRRARRAKARTTSPREFLAPAHVCDGTSLSEAKWRRIGRRDLNIAETSRGLALVCSPAFRLLRRTRRAKARTTSRLRFLAPTHFCDGTSLSDAKWRRIGRRDLNIAETSRGLALVCSPAFSLRRRTRRAEARTTSQPGFMAPTHVCAGVGLSEARPFSVCGRGSRVVKTSRRRFGRPARKLPLGQVGGKSRHSGRQWFSDARRVGRHRPELSQRSGL